jgi:phosphoserine aminotransferase
MIYNFSAGPCCLPREVLNQCQEEMLDWQGSGVSVMEMSHRSEEFVSISEHAKSEVRKFLNVPNNYKIFFFQGGATLQYAAIVKNLLKENKKACYLTTGLWSS